MGEEERDVRGVRVRTGRLQLWRELGLDWDRHTIVCLVGAGGKTTAMFRLASEAAASGKRVIVTTTTRIRKPEENEAPPAVCVLPEGAVARQALRPLPGGIVIVGADAEPGKLKGLSLAETAKLKDFCDVLLVEADGAKRLPLKVPEAWEPVILPETLAVVAVAGLSSLGRPLGETCFRARRAGLCFGVGEREKVTPEIMAGFLASEDGQRKMVGCREYRVLLNQADGCETAKAGLLTARLLAGEGVTFCRRDGEQMQGLKKGIRAAVVSLKGNTAYTEVTEDEGVD